METNDKMKPVQEIQAGTTNCGRCRIYVASLSDYTAGRLHGEWVDADQGPQHVWDGINAMLKASKEPLAEEWAIHDYEGFEGLQLSEYSDIEKVAEVAMLIDEHGPVFAELVSHFGGLSAGLEEAQNCMEFGYHGCFSSIADYVEQFIDDCYSDTVSKLPDFIRYHIDYEAIGHDLECGGDILTFTVNGEVHIFSGNL